MKNFLFKAAFLFFMILLVNISGIAGKKKLSATNINMKVSDHTVYFKFNNTKFTHATILITNALGEEKFFIEDADISSGEFSILIPSAKGVCIVNVLMPGFSLSEKVNLNN